MPITLNGQTGITVPTWTTATRPASPTQGQFGYNTTTNSVDTYNGTSWTSVPQPTSQGTSGQYLQSAGAGAAPVWATLSSSGALIRAPQILTSGTSYTTPSNCTAIYVECGGAGGGSGGVQNGGASSGGGGGGYSAKYFTVTGNTAYTYAIGAAGTAGGNQVSGGSGGNTTFTVGATTITAGGGGGGGYGVGGSYSQANASGGTATNGDMNRTGGVGGSSYFISGNGLVGTQGIGILGNNGGLGVKTTSGSDVAGQAGIGGIIRIWEFT